MLRRGLVIALLAAGAAGMSTSVASAAIADANCPGPPNAMTPADRATQTFTAGRNGGISSGEMFLQKAAGADFVMEIYRASFSVPFGSPIATSATVPDASVANGVPTSVTATFPTPAQVSSGSQYAISLRRVAGTFEARDRVNHSCPGYEAVFNGVSWSIDNPANDFPFATTIEPTSTVTASQRGRELTATVPNDGFVSFSKVKRRGRVLVSPTPSSVQIPFLGTNRPEFTVTVPLLLTKFGRQVLDEKGKVTGKVDVNFNPTGGRAATTTYKVKIKTAGKKK